MKTLSLVVTLATLVAVCSANANLRAMNNWFESATGLEGEAENDYIVMIDGGSTGCKVMAFTVGKTSCGQIISDRLLNPTSESAKVKPGIDKVANDKEKLTAYLNEVVEKAKALVPVEAHATTEIHMRCTGGVRLMPEEAQAELMSKVREHFRANSGFLLVKDEQIGVLPGKMEGVYGWITANYLLSVLTGEHQTHSSIDMGGASLELTFDPKENAVEDTTDVVSVQFDGTKHTVFSHVYEMYGQHEGFQQIVDAGKPTGFSPCLLNGFDDDKNGVSGQGQYEQCKEVVRQVLIKPDAECKFSHCPVNGVYTPKIDGLDEMFVLQSSFYFLWNFMGLDSHATLNTVDRVVKNYCDLTWDEAKQMYPKTPAEFLEVYCFSGSYMVEFLRAVGFGEDDNRIRARGQLRDKELQWTYGYLLDSKCNELH